MIIDIHSLYFSRYKFRISGFVFVKHFSAIPTVSQLPAWMATQAFHKIDLLPVNSTAKHVESLRVSFTPMVSRNFNTKKKQHIYRIHGISILAYTREN